MHVFVFDLDNTLIDRHGALVRFLRGVGVPDPQLHALVVQDALGYSDRLEFCGAIASAVGRGDAASWWVRLQRELGQHVAPHLEIATRLAVLRRAARVAILTNGSHENQRAKLRHSGLETSADRVVVAGELGAWKPDVQAYLACEFSEGTGYTMVGDHPEHDVQAPKSLGWETCWISHGRRWEEGAPPDHTFDNITSALEFLEKRLKR